ncbi:HAMP domain-containing sensor histidine kinase [Caulobacter sp.]|uniref:sensor histidine kinase n=1 Tax=Caulobacter sp. TaxID=78 RepID=UPI001B271B2E|nr:HAMP domain-containing sensor histidine kinase [Caulobacter sp.]MBO9546999.1 HAMP domain-containing histidine kinase [Caulobacter sp.]
MVSKPASRLAIRLGILFLAGAGAQAAWNAGYFASLAICAGIGVWAISRIAAEALEARAGLEATEERLHGALLDRERQAKTLTAFLDHAPAPLLAMRGRDRIEAINLAARRMFGTDDVIVDPPQALVASMLGLEPGVRGALSLDITGSPRAYALTMAELVSEGDVVRIAVLMDVQAEVQVAEAAAHRELMLVLSHEIMNSMTPVTSLAQTAAGLLRDVDRQDEALRQAQQSVESLSRRSAELLRFVDSYRTLARLPEPQKTPTDLTRLLEDMAHLFRGRWDEQGVALRSDIASGLRGRLDGTLLSQAVLNVLTNAAEAALARADKPWVLLMARDHGEHFQITIEDSGSGFGDLDPALVFRPFLSSKPGGSGIGLTITRQIVLAHGGDVVAEAAPGGGARFTILV